MFKFNFRKASATAVGLAILAGSPSFALADEPSPAAIALASTILVDIGLKASVDTVVPGMLGELEASITKIHPEMQSALHETLVGLKPEFDKTEGSVVNDAARVFASHMTEAELRDTQAFFEGTTGKKYLAAQPVILDELRVSVGVWRTQLSKDMLARVREEMKKKGYDF